jgi:hypothetical protein
MPKLILRRAKVVVNGVDLSDHCSAVTVETTADGVDMTAFQGAAYSESAQGFKDATITCTFFQDYGVANVHAVLSALYDGTSPFSVYAYSDSAAPVSSTNPIMAMTARLFGYTPLTGAIGDASSFDVEFRPATGDGLVVASSADIPSNSVAPSIGGGTGLYGETLTISPGTWSGTTFTYQWKRNGTAIPGATAATYTIAEVDAGATITAEVVGSNVFGSSSPVATSNSITARTFYFVSAAGSNANNGLSSAQAVQTLAKLQTLVTSGTQGLLRRGDRWKETLTLPASNVALGAYGTPVPATAGSRFDLATMQNVPITYDSAAPVIDGGEFVTGWASYSGGVSDSYLTDNWAGTGGADLTTSTAEVSNGGAWTLHPGLVGSSAVLTGSGGVRRNTVGSTQYYFSYLLPQLDHYLEATFHVYDLSTTLGSIRLTTRTSSTAQTFYFMTVDPTSGGQFNLGDFLNATGTNRVTTAYALTVGHDYRMRMEVTGYNTALIKGFIKDLTAGDTSFTAVGSYTASGIDPGNTPSGTTGYAGIRMGGGSAAAPTNTQAIQFQTNIDVGPFGAPFTPVNTYQATAASDPYIVDLRGALSRRGLGANQLADGESYWTGGKLYLRSDAGAPSNTDVIGGSRANGVVGSTLTNTTFDGIAFEHTKGEAIVFTGGSGTTIRRCIAQRTGADSGTTGVWRFSNHSNLTVDQCVLRQCATDGVYMSQCANYLIQDCYLGFVDSPFADCVQHDGSDAFVAGGTIQRCFITQRGSLSPKGCTVLFCQGHTVQDCHFDHSNSFGVSCPGSHYVIRRNVFYDVGVGGGFRIADNVSTAFDDHLVHHNLFIECNPAISVVSLGGAARTTQRYIANTIYNSAVQPLNLPLVSLATPMGGEFTDNIVWNASGAGQLVSVSSQHASGWNSNYNVLGSEAAAFINWLGTTYSTLAAYRTASSKDANSLNSNPLIVATGSDPTGYRLQATSPALSAGTNVTGIVTNSIIGAMTQTGLGS